MNIIPNTCHPSLNQWWKHGIRTVCLNWPLKFKSQGLVNDYNAWKNLQKERRMFCGPFGFFVCVAVFKLLVFKISTF